MLPSIVILLAAPADAVAYLDPGTGSILLQGLIAAIAGALMVIRGRWHKLREFFHRRSRRSESEPDPRDER